MAQNENLCSKAKEMCNRFTLVSHINQVTRKFNLKVSSQIELFKSYNISPSQQSPIICSDNANEVELCTFGYAAGSQNSQDYVINARAEGSAKYYNKDNSINYKGAFHIKDSREFGYMFRTQRCLILANCFFEGPKNQKLSKPYLVYLRSRRIFFLAGIWKECVNKNTRESTKSYVVLTTYPNKLMKDHIKNQRTPIIIEEHNYHRWLDSNTPLRDITQQLHPLADYEMNAYRVSDRVNDKRYNDPKLIEPISQRVYAEHDYILTGELERTGFGDSPAWRRRGEANKRYKL